MCTQSQVVEVVVEVVVEGSPHHGDEGDVKSVGCDRKD
jgi:hypothetical protein